MALHRGQTEGYRVELRFSDPRSEAEIPPERGLAPLDVDQLLPLQNDPDVYGRRLAEMLFDDAGVKSLYQRARAATEAADLFLRLRLLVGPTAPELMALRWELLRDPDSDALLAMSEKTLFSRFMVSRDWRPVRLQPKSELTALVAVAAPSNLGKYGLAEVDLDGEVGRAEESLKGIRVTVVGQDQPLTPKRLVKRLRAGIDVLYLACHGALSRKTGEPVLYLQKDSGEVGVARGADLARRISEMPQPPRLAVLASCESGLLGAPPARGDGTASTAGDDKPAAQSSLAPLLAEAGVPAVIAMQGKISMATVEQAMPVFFRELLVDGQIDRAMAVARGAVRERADSWMPALYLRLKGGRIWYEPGFAGGDEFKKWRSICSSVRQGTFVPILGPTLDERVRGARGSLARRLADKHDIPRTAYQRLDLAKVAQLLTVRESRRFATTEILEELRSQLAARHPELAGDDLKTMFKDLTRRRYPSETDPFRILANLGGSVFINAGLDPLLPLALAEAGAKPRPLFSTWRKTRDSHPQEPQYEGTPSAENPIVYYPFGFVAKPGTLVLTEDDYLDYLIAASDYKLIPRVVRGTLVESSLLFLGFSLDDWSFRVLYRLIMALDGSAELAELTHVGVQVDPSEADRGDIEQAREYLQTYLGSGRGAPPIDVYWGTAVDFLNELRERLAASDDEPAAPVVADEDEDDWVSF